MKTITLSLVTSFLMSATSLMGGEGEKIYGSYCAACHSVDGKGAGNGVFPPLAGSEWVKGDPARAIKILLHGLDGPLEVAGEAYNLAMPPQGAVLSDAQIAEILNYVRSNWGNKEAEISVGEVKAIRAKYPKGREHWTADELLAEHPLKPSDPPIKNLISYFYRGTWKSLPDFSKLEPDAVEEEHDGLISASHGGRKDNFGLVWEGDIEAPETGEYVFRLDADDGAALFIDKQLIAKVVGVSRPNGKRAREEKIQLTKGDHPIRIEYFERGGHEEITLSMRGPGIDSVKFLSRARLTRIPPITIEPEPGQAVIYRNFIEGVSPRAIGVGYDRRLNLAFDAHYLGMPLIWTGHFMDGSRHWVERGKGFQPPAGDHVVDLGLQPFYAVIGSRDAPWPEAHQEELPFRFGGYRMDRNRHPSFFYDVGRVGVIDESSPVTGPEGSALMRTLLFENPTDAEIRLWMHLAKDAQLAADGAGGYALGSGATLVVEEATDLEPVLRGEKGERELLLPLRLLPGSTRVRLNYSWQVRNN